MQSLQLLHAYIAPHIHAQTHKYARARTHTFLRQIRPAMRMMPTMILYVLLDKPQIMCTDIMTMEEKTGYTAIAVVRQELQLSATKLVTSIAGTLQQQHCAEIIILSLELGVITIMGETIDDLITNVAEIAIDAQETVTLLGQ